MKFTEQDIAQLREEIKKRLNVERFSHTLGVEREAAALGELYLPQSLDELRVAALLHDVTKTGKGEEQVALCQTLGIVPTEDERKAPQVLHGKTAAALIPIQFPQFATPRVLSAVANHTTGNRGMSTFDMIIFLADYIEPTREHEICQKTRELFWNVTPDILYTEKHLKEIVLVVLENTIAHLKAKKMVIDERTLATYQWLLEDLGVCLSQGDNMEEKNYEVPIESKEMTEQLVALLYKKGASNIVAYFVGDDTTLTDYHIIASARSTTHARAMADDLDYEMSKVGIEKRAIEGKDGGAWVLLDFYSVIVHIFEPSQREFYNLERLQKQANAVDISDIIAQLEEN